MTRQERINAFFARIRAEDSRQLDDDIRAVLQTAPGRRLLMAVICKGGVYAPLGPTAGAYEAGRRDAALELLRSANQTARKLSQLAANERSELSEKRDNELKQIEGENE